MFTKPRPVPSKGALKVLYQLAYITAGTCVGFGTLCAEEQRRRVQVLQKVADNAKKIRQHPRYRHNAALAIHDGGDADLELLRTGLLPRRRQRGRLDGQYQPGEHEGDIDRRFMLAHSSDAESDRTDTPREQKRVPPLRALHASKSSESQQDWNSTAHRQHPSDSKHTTENVGRGKAQKRHDKSFDLAGNDDTVLKGFQRADRNVSSKLKPFERKRDLETQTVSAPGTVKQAYDALVAEDIEFLTRSVWNQNAVSHSTSSEDPLASNLSEVSGEDVHHDVKLLVDKTATRGFQSNDASIRDVRIAKQLQRLALGKGMLDELNSLYLWRFSQGTHTDVDAQEFCDAWRRLLFTHEAGDVAQFHATLFASQQFQRLGLRVRLKYGLNVLSHALLWQVDVEPYALLDAVLGVGRTSVDRQEIMQALESHCKGLLADSAVPFAAELFLTVAQYIKSPAKSLALADKIFQRAMESGQLHAGAKLLRWRRKLMKPKDLTHQLDAFIKACGDRRAYDLIIDLFLRNDCLDMSLEALSRFTNGKSKGIIAIACSLDSSVFHVFEMMYRDMPEYIRRSVSKHALAKKLKATWNSTRNLEAVEAERTRLTNLVKGTDDNTALQNLDRAMVQIYIEANKGELALVAISNAHAQTNEATSVNISLAALLFARMGLWEYLARLIEVAESSSTFSFNNDSSNLFNKVIGHYSRKHSAAETWKFVTTAMEKLNFLPKSTTTEIMLRCFVANKSIDLVSRWLEMLKTLGHQVEINAKLSSKLLTTWYLNHRPGHVRVMWLCHRLTQGAPSLAGEDYVDLVKEAVGYDLKKMSGQNASWRREHAKQRIEYVVRACESLKSGGAMPRPGYRYDEQLYLDTMKARPPSLEETIAPTLKTEHREAKIGVPLQLHEREPEELSVSAAVDQDGVIQTSNRATDNGETCAKVASTTRPQDLGPHAQRGLGTQQIFMDVSQYPDFGDGDAGASMPLVPPAPTKPSAVTEFEEGIGFTNTLDDIRPAYEKLHLYLDESSRLGNGDVSRRSKVERDMILALRAGQYKMVLDLYYKEGSSRTGPLPTPVILESAVEASLRLHNGDRRDADKIMSKARAAGMNVTCAMGPLLIHQMYRLDASNQQELKDLRLAVIDYYRVNEENGWPVTHYVGVSAANVLIDNRYPKHGLNVLAVLLHSKWIADLPFDIVSMSVFLKGYNAIKSLQGVGWVVKNVLDQNIPIDARFLHTLKMAQKDRPERIRTAYLDPWLQLCRKRKLEQERECVHVGEQLVACLQYCAKVREPVAIDSRRELHEQVAPASMDDPNTSPSDFHRDLSTYRHFLRRPIVLPDGRWVPYRYRATGELGRNVEATLRFAAKRQKPLSQRRERSVASPAPS